MAMADRVDVEDSTWVGDEKTSAGSGGYKRGFGS
jgi:hypothetical protein